jgi:hypothetical protein
MAGSLKDSKHFTGVSGVMGFYIGSVYTGSTLLCVTQADTKYITNIYARISSGPTSEVLYDMLSRVR